MYRGHSVPRGSSKPLLSCQSENAKNPSVSIGFLIKKNPYTLDANDEECGPEIHPGTETWISNLTTEVLSWTHKREMVSSDVIKQGQCRAIYFWTRMESVTGLLMGS